MAIVHRLMDTYDLFTREQIAIYPFDPRGVQERGLGFENLRVEEIATQTGGAAIYNSNDYKSAVAKVVDDTSHFYTLSYIPRGPPTTATSTRLQITVDHPACTSSTATATTNATRRPTPRSRLTSRWARRRPAAPP